MFGALQESLTDNVVHELADFAEPNGANKIADHEYGSVALNLDHIMQCGRLRATPGWRENPNPIGLRRYSGVDDQPRSYRCRLNSTYEFAQLTRWRDFSGFA